MRLAALGFKLLMVEQHTVKDFHFLLSPGKHTKESTTAGNKTEKIDTKADNENCIRLKLQKRI